MKNIICLVNHFLMSVTYLLNEARAEGQHEVANMLQLTQSQIIKLVVEKLLSFNAGEELSGKQLEIVEDFLVRISIATPNSIIELVSLLSEDSDSMMHADEQQGHTHIESLDFEHKASTCGYQDS